MSSISPYESIGSIGSISLEAILGILSSCKILGRYFGHFGGPGAQEFKAPGVRWQKATDAMFWPRVVPGLSFSEIHCLNYHILSK